MLWRSKCHRCWLVLASEVNVWLLPLECSVLSGSSRESSCSELVRLWQRRKLYANSVWPLKDSGGKDKSQGTFSTLCLAPAHTWQMLFPTFNPWCSLTSPLTVATGSIRSSKWANQVISPLILTWWSSQYFRPCLHSAYIVRSLPGSHTELRRAILKCDLKVLNKVLNKSLSSGVLLAAWGRRNSYSKLQLPLSLRGAHLQSQSLEELRQEDIHKLEVSPGHTESYRMCASSRIFLH